MIGGMDESLKKRLAYFMRLARTTIITSSFGAIVVGAVYVDPHNPIRCRKMAALSFYAGWAAVGIIGGATLIYQVVRRTNRRDDPRHAKRPRDAP